VQLEHSFTVPVGIDEAWKVLLDIEQVAPCMPGAALESVDGDDFTGIVKVKLGPIGLTYKGKASFIEKDEAAHRAVIDARGRDARGNGTATAKVTATLTEDGDATKVDVLTDLDITGKPAQFGRGVMADVGDKLIGQFATCLAGKLTGAEPAVTPTPTAAEQPAVTPTPTAADESEDPAVTPAPKPRPKPRVRAAAAAEAATAVTPPPEPTVTEPTVTEPAVTSERASPSEVVAEEPAVTPSPAARHAAANRRPEDVEPINLIESAGPAVAKRLAPIVALVILLVLLLRRRRH
jgi:carbon monoxide dehydrogenase subunit G